MSDLSPDEMKEVLAALEAGGAKVTDKTLMVRSHVWRSIDDRYIWGAFVLGTDHGAWGEAPTIPACYEAIDAKVVEWYPEASDPAKRMTVARIVPE